MTCLVEPTSSVVARHPGRCLLIRMNFDGPEPNTVGTAARDDSGALLARRMLLSCHCQRNPLSRWEPQEDERRCLIRLPFLEPRVNARARELVTTVGDRYWNHSLRHYDVVA